MCTHDTLSRNVMRNKIDRNSVISCKFQQKLKVLRQTIEGLRERTEYVPQL